LGIDVTLVETGRLPAGQIGSTTFAVSGQFPIAPSEIEPATVRDSGLHPETWWLSSADFCCQNHELSGHTARRFRRPGVRCRLSSVIAVATGDLEVPSPS
jgi:hypothetical protein